MVAYKVPEEFFFRIHHVRPRFKSDIENVLIYMAEKITAIGECPRDKFVERIDDAILSYSGNAGKTKKTINNWRTEISALFGFIEHTDVNDKPGRRAIELAENQDLVECFKVFLYNYQYPGAHIKPNYLLEQIEKGVHFKPVQYILKILQYAKEKEGRAEGLTKAEICHCVFNDLRVTRDNEGPEKTWQRIKSNRDARIQYDQTGDVVRYAGDIIDYMEIANLLKTYDSRMYYLNDIEEEVIIKFINSNEWFDKYDEMISNRSGTLSVVKNYTQDWFAYVNRSISVTDFSTDILTYIAKDKYELDILKESTKMDIDQETFDLTKRNEDISYRISNESDNFSTKDIGDIGEGLVHAHECMRIKNGGREDLVHLIKRIPSQYAVGYDINSVELSAQKRFIEVKTTISAKPLHFNSVHMTKNEWNTADSTRERYYIYRLMISKKQCKLYLLQNPVGLYKGDKITMVPNDGADITFNPKEVGKFEELLTWKR